MLLRSLLNTQHTDGLILYLCNSSRVHSVVAEAVVAAVAAAVHRVDLRVDHRVDHRVV